MESCRDVDLTILTIDPASLSAPDAGRTISELASAMEWLGRSAPEGMIAIAYTKADEYGVITPKTLRIIDKNHALVVPRLDENLEWDKFVQTLGQTSFHTGKARITPPGMSRLAEAGPTISWVLERSRSLWEALAASKRTMRLLNAYFVCADPHDKLFVRPEERGLPQLLADFGARLEVRER